ncbi:MAG TPA: EAL domain-containing protein [Plasticicumulans sp.]|nr:EAL domain-containing protein [Plasticicumulans sp.]
MNADPRRWLRRATLAWRIGLYLAAASAVPLLLTGYLSYHMAADALLREATHSVAAAVEAQRRYIEAQMAQVESLLANLAGVEAITAAAIEEQSDADTYDRLATQARIGYILNGYSSLRGLVSIDLIGAGGRHYHVGDTLEAVRLDEEQRRRLFEAAQRSGRTVHWSGIGPNINVHSAYRKVITAARLLYRVERETLRREPVALLLVSYDPDELARQFDDVALGNGAWFVAVDGDGRLLYHPDARLRGERLATPLLETLRDAQGSRSVNIAGHDYLLAHARAVTLGWTIAGFVPLDTLAAPVAPIRWASFGLVAGCLLFALLMAIRLHAKVIAPLRAVIRQLQRFERDPAGAEHLGITNDDEIGELTRWYNRSLDAVHALRDSEERAQHAALHDVLTGLANRTLLIDHITHAQAAVRRQPERPCALLFIDLDHFKPVNDRLGHEAGDKLLCAIAQRIGDCVRSIDVLARLGGDEFAVLLTRLDEAGRALRIATRIVECVRRPVTIDGHEVQVGASIGIAIGDGTQDAEALLRDADIAMYRAKQTGKSRCELFDAALGAQVLERVGLEFELRRALERGQLAMHYQPIVALADDRIVACEALMRWQHPELGAVAPDRFIPIAEETGLIAELGAWALASACAQAASWRARWGEAAPAIAVNLSPRQLGRPDFCEQVAACFAEHGIGPGMIHLEITETALLADLGHADRLLACLRGLGATIHLDDFGTGYSSLSYLSRLQVDAIKIDRAFVRRLDPAHDGPDLVRAILLIADELGLTVVAEGIETEYQHQRLAALGCAHGQGWRFGRAAEPAAIETQLRRQLVRTG